MTYQKVLPAPSAEIAEYCSRLCALERFWAHKAQADLRVRLYSAAARPGAGGRESRRFEVSGVSTNSAALVHRVAVITGATGGIGSAICRRLAESGAAVVVGFRRDRNKAETLVSSLAGAAASHHCALHVDVVDEGTLTSFAEEISARYGRADILVNCVGTTRFVPHADLAGLGDELIDEIFRTNWRGPFATIRALTPLLEKAFREPVSSAPADEASQPPSHRSSSISLRGSNHRHRQQCGVLRVEGRAECHDHVARTRACAFHSRRVGVAGSRRDRVHQRARRTVEAGAARPDAARPVGVSGEVADAVLAVATTLRSVTGCVIPIDGGRPLA